MQMLRSIFSALALLGLTAAPGTSMALATGSVEGTITIKRGLRYKKDRSNVVIVIQGVPDSKAMPPEHSVVIDQTDKTFHPRLTVIPAGTTVDFPNNDRVFHNVFSVSRATTFDLGLYKSGSSKSVTFERPGVIDIYCNIHPEMSAKMLVVGTKHHVITGPDGSFSLEGIPPGKYPFMAWRAMASRRGESSRGQGQPRHRAPRDLQVPHPKDGTPYGRYK